MPEPVPGGAPRERNFRLPAGRLAALEWGRTGGTPVIALHGWLDNAGSFDLIGPELPDWHLIALDSAGHGRSDARSADSGYNIWQDLADILAVADELGWQRFSLLGHSRGGAIAMLFAASFPERVERLMLIEGGLPIIGVADDAPANLRQVLERSSELAGGTGGRVFAERTQAIRERVDGFSPVTAEAAEILARRSLLEVAGGWQWQADQRLKAGSEMRLTRELLAAFVKRVQAPSICVLAGESPFADLDVYKEMLALFPDIEVHRIPGRHHLHLEGAAETIAGLLQDFQRR